jgi:hypothetical protein
MKHQGEGGARFNRCSNLLVFPARIVQVGGVGLFGLVFLVVALVLVGIGFAIGLVGSIFAAILVALGVISSSFVIGIRAGRPAVGIRAFLLQCGILLGIPAGSACAWLAQSFFAAYGSGWPVLIYGAIGGAFAGVLVAFSLDFISRRLHGWAAARLTSKPESCHANDRNSQPRGR